MRHEVPYSNQPSANKKGPQAVTCGPKGLYGSGQSACLARLGLGRRLDLAAEVIQGHFELLVLELRLGLLGGRGIAARDDLLVAHVLEQLVALGARQVE